MSNYILPEKLGNEILKCIALAVHNRPYHEIAALLKQIEELKPVKEEKIEEKEEERV